MESNILLKEYNQNELNKLRRFQNSKMEIYQYLNEPILRPKNTTQDYKGSFEEIQILNICTNKLSSCSNLLYFSLNDEISNNLIKHKIKKIFHKKNIAKSNILYSNLELKHSEYSKKAFLDKIKKEIGYIQLSNFIDTPQFDITMRTKLNIARWVLNHEFLQYHPRYEEIKSKYSIYLCPYKSPEINKQEDNSNNDENESESQDVDVNQEENDFYN